MPEVGHTVADARWLDAAVRALDAPVLERREAEREKAENAEKKKRRERDGGAGRPPAGG